MSLAANHDVQKLSRVLFGQTHRLAVMLGIARGPRAFMLSDLARELGFENLSSIQDPIRDLEDAGLIERLPRVSNRVRFQRNSSLVWRWVKQVGEDVSV